MDALTVSPGGVLEVRNHARKGRSLYTSRIVKGGEIIIDEAPLLLLVAPEMAQSTCVACLRAVGPKERIECPVCFQACFCSPSCQLVAQGTPWLHSVPLCSAYKQLAALGLSTDDQAQLRFLLHALALRHAGTPESKRRFAALCSLVGEPTEAEHSVAARLAPYLKATLAGLNAVESLPLNGEELAMLLRKEQLNSYGVLASQQQVATAAVLQIGGSGVCGNGGGTTCGGRVGAGCSSNSGGAEVPPGEREDGERRLRGSALYAQASLVNHECLPNVARFDFFDSGRPNSTHVTFRALHDLPPGTELAQSYVPLHWGLAERQAQCRDVYGFDCTCPRCQTESQWSDDEGEDDDESEWETDTSNEDLEADDAAVTAAGEAATGQSRDAGASGLCGGQEVEMQDAQPIVCAPPGEEGPLEPTYLRLFLLKYMCAAPGCFGTAAPVKPGSTLLECNVCGRTRSEREFLREIERSQQQQQQMQMQLKKRTTRPRSVR
ncbi:hypothetical protein VaNZ11_004662 [Volvox africanus]|uniref:SET domain-containing protein n=1 Tax=Volvox africanus TaxID=51714 RepID=A0ABQ5RXH6_9CHLO|nr:hypothetical protein VaNZ11_004662 [Volvox africanus]